MLKERIVGEKFHKREFIEYLYVESIVFSMEKFVLVDIRCVQYQNHLLSSHYYYTVRVRMCFI